MLKKFNFNYTIEYHKFMHIPQGHDLWNNLIPNICINEEITKINNKIKKIVQAFPDAVSLGASL